ncbi:hypothetical protein HOLleu_23762 [Holothuria leucospilota]|uniref:Methyltransferase type 11 domain-containing protein n=1 Tax=Holothuria leucospilota TaxID=206669 RepID=A0A9Q1BVH3_HOLLE|nr:hypothetical protein HOLleu_23762 [Holothuria leucospilota]
MEGKGINRESGATEIFRFIKENHDCPGKNDIRDLYDTITPSYDKLYKSGYKDVIGVDVSPKSLDIAEQKGVYKKLICDEILPKGMPFKTDEFDVVICSGSIAPGHISPECFSEWTRIVKPGGFVVIVLRRCYVELQKDREYLHSAKLGESFQAEIRNLEKSKRWEVVLRQTFPGYIYEDGLLNDGIAVACRVLNHS